MKDSDNMFNPFDTVPKSFGRTELLYTKVSVHSCVCERAIKMWQQNSNYIIIKYISK